jgi:hypothetical protein
MRTKSIGLNPYQRVSMKHSEELCKKKLECIVGFLDEIQDQLEYPKTDREQWVRVKLELALQDLEYLSGEFEDEH